tara:strand:+ start:359 stop:1084 length:726 start_codon:yes stop_codon:yes gene_type:complete
MNGLDLRKLRKKFGFSRNNFARYIDISVHTLDSWEGGKRNIPNIKAELIKMKLDKYAPVSLKIINDTFVDTTKPEDKITNNEDLFVKDIYVVPVKKRKLLEGSYFADEVITKLKNEKITLKEPSSNESKWFKIEIEGISMDDSTKGFDGSKFSLLEGDWAYCRTIPRTNWRDKLHLNKVEIFCLFHNTRGIIFNKLKSYNVETGDLTLTSLNPDKEQFPDIKINVGECSYIFNIIKVLSVF